MSAEKARGTAFETAVVGYLRDHGFPYAERRALRGKRDQGDVTGIPGVVLECKNHKRHALAEWWEEAEAERVHAAADIAAVVFKRKGKGNPAAQYVLTDLVTFVQLLKEAGR